MCLLLSMCTCRIDRFLAVRQRDRNVRYRTQTVAFDTFPPQNQVCVTESIAKKESHWMNLEQLLLTVIQNRRWKINAKINAKAGTKLAIRKIKTKS